MSQKEGERGSVDWQAGPITLTGMGSQLRMLQHATNLIVVETKEKILDLGLCTTRQVLLWHRHFAHVRRTISTVYTNDKIRLGCP